MSVALRERALRLLARREHARNELAGKLSAHAGSAGELDALLDDLVKCGLLSDERYVEMRLNARCQRFGNARLAYELRTQGVSESLVDAALSACGSELARARRVWQQRYGNTPGKTDTAERARQTRFLMSRGFPGEIIRRVLRGDLEDD